MEIYINGILVMNSSQSIPNIILSAFIAMGIVMAFERRDEGPANTEEQGCHVAQSNTLEVALGLCVSMIIPRGDT